MKSSRLSMALALLIACGACGESPTGIAPPSAPTRLTPVDLSNAWSVASPADVGVDEAGLADAIAEASGISRVRSLLVVKRGKIVAEHYFRGTSRESLHDVRSITKSIVGTLAALAVDDGHIESLDDPIQKYLDSRVAPLNAEQSLITIRHLLTMTAGFDWDESDGAGDYGLWIRSSDHIETLLQRPLVAPPGTGFRYNSAAVHLLGVVIEEAVGVPLRAYAEEALFRPIGIGAAQWESLTSGFVNGGSGIDLAARDLARLGQLYLQDGISGSQRILPEGWVGTATRPAFSWRSRFGPLDNFTYGHLWWVSESQPEAAYLAWGYGGQFIYVVPTLDLVVVVTTDWAHLSEDGGPAPLELAVLRVLVDRIHTAAR